MLSAYPGIFSNMIFVAQCVQFAYAATTLPLFQRSFARRLNTRDNTFQIVVSNNCLFASKITFTLFVIISIACVHFCRPRNQAGMHLFVCLFGLLHYGAFVVWAGVFRGCLLLPSSLKWSRQDKKYNEASYGTTWRTSWLHSFAERTIWFAYKRHISIFPSTWPASLNESLSKSHDWTQNDKKWPSMDNRKNL